MGAYAGARCTVDEDLYLNYRHLDCCDLEGDARGVRFQVKNYAQTPIDFDSTVRLSGLTIAGPASCGSRSPRTLRGRPRRRASPARPVAATPSTF
jgi:hypothetical protein